MMREECINENDKDVRKEKSNEKARRDAEVKNSEGERM